MQFIQEHTVDSSLIEEFENIVAKETSPFNPSEVYNAVADEKTIRPDLRLSEFRTLTTPALFNTAEALLHNINTSQNINTYQKSAAPRFVICKNDVMHIKYTKGGYFKEHEDYLSITSNFIEEYSLLVCIDGTYSEGTGGRTILKINNFFTYKSEASCTKGHALLFRKDIQHEGEVLHSGTKEILTFNVWAIHPDIEQVIVVSFENDTRTCNIDGNKINAFPYKTLLKIVLSTGVGKENNGTIVTYKSHHTFEEFEIIANIYNNKAITYQQVKNYQDILDYHLFDYKKLLIKTVEDSIEPRKINNVIISKDAAMVVCSTEEDFLVYRNTFKEDSSYVPFKMIFAEGSLSFGGEMSGTEPATIRMIPVYASFTDKNAVMFIQNIMGAGPDIHNYNFEPLHIDADERFATLPDHELFQLKCTEDDSDDTLVTFRKFDDEYNLEGKCVTYDLQGAFEDSSMATLTDLITNRKITHILRKVVSDINDDIRNTIEELNLYEFVQDNLNNLSIPNAQRMSRSHEEFYCNENVYGNFNLIAIYGFMNIANE
jgi:hypothetical protein